MKININKAGIPLDENELSKFETEIGYNLPDSYRQFLLESNGGSPIPEFFDVPSWKFKSSLIQRLKGLDSNYIGVDLREIRQIKGDLFPSGFMAIGSDPGGNLILIGLDGDTEGMIYFWDHEQQPQDQLPKLEEYVNVHHIADSFEQFIQSLKTAKEMGWE